MSANERIAFLREKGNHGSGRTNRETDELLALVKATMREASELDAAIIAHRADPNEATRAAVLAAQTDQNDAFNREQIADYQRRTH